MSLNRSLIWVGILASMLVFSPSAGRADTVYLKDGSVKEGNITDENDDEIILEVQKGTIRASLHVPKAEIDRVDLTPTTREALVEEEKKIGEGDAEGWYKQGMKYKKAGMDEEAKTCFEKALKADAQHEGAATQLGRVDTGSGDFSSVGKAMKDASTLLDEKKYEEAARMLEALLELPATSLNSLQRKDVLTDLVQCRELQGQWDKAQEAYDNLLKCTTVDKSEVAVIRLKQRILSEHPDGMVDLAVYEARAKEARAGLPGLEGLVTLPLEAVKAGPDAGGGSRKGKSGKDQPGHRSKGATPQAKDGKLPLSNPRVMEVVIRAEAEGILLDAQHKLEKADAQAQSEKIWEATPFPILGNIVTPSGRRQLAYRPSPADKLYADAADDAENADYFVPGISVPFRLKIAQKRVALLDTHIANTRKEMESHSYYQAPAPPGASPAQVQALTSQQNQRLQTMAVSAEQAEKYQEIVNRLEALEAKKLELLEPFSDQILQQVEKIQKEREVIAEVRKKAEKVGELADAIKENEKMEAQIQENYIKAKANQPTNFEYGLQPYISGDGLYHYKDGGKKWRAQTDYCVGYCEKTMDIGRKRIALLKKFPERTQFARDIDLTKGIMVQVYQLEQNVLMEREQKGKAARYY